jgi:hypothetical protein
MDLFERMSRTRLLERRLSGSNEYRTACGRELRAGRRACDRHEPGIGQSHACELIAEAQAVDGQRVPGVVGDRAAAGGDRPQHSAVAVAQLGEN